MSELNCGPVIDRLLAAEPDFALVVGVHTGQEAQLLGSRGARVTGVDVLPPYTNGYEHIRGRFENVTLPKVYDCALCSHTLEHMENVGQVLCRFAHVLRPDGLLGLVVPGYPQDEFFVGHYTLWTPALLIYNLAANGWDCRDAEYYTSADHRHIGLVVPNRKIPDMPDAKGWDVIGGLQHYLPVPFRHKMNAWLPDKWDYLATK